MAEKVYRCDLHTHTTRSDGAETPMEVIRRASACGISILAITDHDIVPKEWDVNDDGKWIRLKEYAAVNHVNLLLGTEISCETEVEDVHIICLGCDWKAPWFAKMEAAVARSRTACYKKLVECLADDGMDITWEEILYNNGVSVGEEHVLKKMIFELMAKKGYATDWSEAKLLVKNTKRYQIQREKPNPLEVIQAVRRTGGITILAHPFLISEQVCMGGELWNRQAYIDYLIGGGLDGIEACYTYDKTSYEGTMKREEIESYIRQNYVEKVKILSGGSDYHGDWKKGVENARELGECGVTEEYFNGNELLARLRS